MFLANFGFSIFLSARQNKSSWPPSPKWARAQNNIPSWHIPSLREMDKRDCMFFLLFLTAKPCSFSSLSFFLPPFLWLKRCPLPTLFHSLRIPELSARVRCGLKKMLLLGLPATALTAKKTCCCCRRRCWCSFLFLLLRRRPGLNWKRPLYLFAHTALPAGMEDSIIGHPPRSFRKWNNSVCGNSRVVSILANNTKGGGQNRAVLMLPGGVGPRKEGSRKFKKSPTLSIKGFRKPRISV